MQALLNPNEELDVYLCIHASKDRITLISRNTKLTLLKVDCKIEITLGCWVALKIDKNTQTPLYIAQIDAPLETALDQNGELVVHCRAAIAETEAIQYAVPEKFVWSPEFEFIYDDNEKMTEDRGCRTNYLYTIAIKPLENVMPMPGYARAMTYFEVVDIIGDAEQQIDICSAPWINRSAHIPDLTATSLSRRDDISKVNQNTFFKGVVCQSRCFGERTEFFVWSRNAGRFRVALQLQNRIKPKVGDWVKFQLKLGHGGGGKDGPEAHRVHSLHTEEPRETDQEPDNRGTTRALMLVRVVLTDPRGIEAVDQEIGSVGIKGLIAALRDKGYDIDELIEMRNIVKFWAKFQMRDANRHWEFHDLGENPVEDSESYETPLPKGDLINF